MKKIILPQLAWFGAKKLELPVPDSWQVEQYRMAGHDRPALKPAAIKKAVATPIGSPPLHELARGKKEVVIVFDDMARVTRVAEIVPHILAELAEAGIVDSQIRFICGLGCHGGHDRLDFVKKLGEDVVARFPVYNHNPFGPCTYVGTTRTFGTKVYISDEVMKCDLRIGIGSVVPHPMSGYGGGGKIVLPGIASYATIEHNHRLAIEDMKKNRDKPVAGMGLFEKNPMRIDIEEAAVLSGLDVLVNAVVNMWGETVALYTGALVPTYAAAIKDAVSNYCTPRTNGENIVIANTFAKANEAMMLGLGAAFRALNPQGGEAVLIANAPDGQVTHYLMGSFGNNTGAALRLQARVPRFVNKVVVYSEYPDLAGRTFIEQSDKVAYLSQWDKVVEMLQEQHPDGARVAVFPLADIQYCA